jgi:hypothetical protein
MSDLTNHLVTRVEAPNTIDAVGAPALTASKDTKWQVATTVTHEFDKFNNLTMTITYGELEFSQSFAESYLDSPADWATRIGHIETSGLEFSQDTQSWQEIHVAKFPLHVRDAYLAELRIAIKDPRIALRVSDDE